MIDLDVRLSPHFTLRELVHTNHRHIDNIPPPDIVVKLRRLCVVFLEPVRERFGPLYVSSGYRCPLLNQTIGGSEFSAHMFGSAADFVSPVFSSRQIVEWILKSDLQYDQVIDEYSSTANWTHLGMVRPVDAPKVPRLEALTMRRGKYTPFRLTKR